MSKIARMRFLPAISLASVLMGVGLTGCVEDNIPRAQQSSAVAVGVQWESLRTLDDLAHRGERAGELNDPEALRALAASTREVALQVASEPIPSGARDPQQARVLQDDLRSLADALADAEALGDESLVPALQAFLPITHRLMAASALPHVHGAPAGASAGGAPMALADIEEIEGPGPNGGTILEITHTAHAELVVDSESGVVRLYTLDGSEEPTRFDDPMSAEMRFEGWTSRGEQVSVALFPDAGDLTYDHFEGLDEKLRGVRWIAGRVTGKFREAGIIAQVNVEAGWPPEYQGDPQPDSHDHDHDHEGEHDH